MQDALESLADRTLDMAFAFHDQATYATAHYNRFREEVIRQNREVIPHLINSSSLASIQHSRIL